MVADSLSILRLLDVDVGASFVTKQLHVLSYYAETTEVRLIFGTHFKVGYPDVGKATSRGLDFVFALMIHKVWWR
jgi:hypothetical protein